MTTKDFLPYYLLDIMKDGTWFTYAKLQKTVSVYSAIEIKEALLNLLKDEAVQNAGSHWRISKNTNPPVAETSVLESPVEHGMQPEDETAQQESHLFVRCPNCSSALDIEVEYVGAKVECPLCNQVFIISDQKLSTNEYAVKPFKPKAAKDS